MKGGREKKKLTSVPFFLSMNSKNNYPQYKPLSVNNPNY